MKVYTVLMIYLFNNCLCFWIYVNSNTLFFFFDSGVLSTSGLIRYCFAKRLMAKMESAFFRLNCRSAFQNPQLLTHLLSWTVLHIYFSQKRAQSFIPLIQAHQCVRRLSSSALNFSVPFTIFSMSSFESLPLLLVMVILLLVMVILSVLLSQADTLHLCRLWLQREILKDEGLFRGIPNLRLE